MVLVGKLEGKRPLGRPRPRWEDNIKVDLQEIEIGCVGVGWIDLAPDMDRWPALVNAVMNLWVPLNARNFLNSRELVSFSRRNLLRGISK